MPIGDPPIKPEKPLEPEWKQVRGARPGLEVNAKGQYRYVPPQGVVDLPVVPKQP